MTQNADITRLFVGTLILSIQDKPKISEYSCLAIEKLAESLQPTDPNQNHNALTPYFEEAVRCLIQNASRECDSPNINLVNTSYSGLISLVQHSCLQSKTLIF